MTPLALRVMEKVRHRDHGTYERWVGAIVDATLDEAAEQLDIIMLEIMGQHSNAAVLVRSLMTPDEPTE